MVLDNDPTDLGGALAALSVRKLMRGLEVARDNRLPCIQLVESAGGDLRAGGAGLGGEREASMRRNLGHFAESGRMFQKVIEEAPSRAVDGALRERIGASALAAPGRSATTATPAPSSWSWSRPRSTGSWRSAPACRSSTR